ncbi:MAG: hypothetical protein ACI37U_07425 [Bacteroides sp.]
MTPTLSLEAIYKMLSTLSASNKKWLADHLYQDLEQHSNEVMNRQKDELTLSFSKGWMEIKDALENKTELQTAEDLLEELNSL